MAILASNDFTIANILYSHALLLPTKSSKNEVVCKKKLKDFLRSTCQISSERRVLDLESEVYQRPGFNRHLG